MSSLAFLGAGAMGAALMRGLLQAQVYQPAQITAFDVDPQRVRALSDETGIHASSDAVAAVCGADVVLLAVKPQMVSAALQPLRDVLTAQQTLVSIVAGVSTGQLEKQLARPVPVVRVMPNTPCLVGEAASALCAGAHAEPSHVQRAITIFDAVGLVVEVSESALDAVTGLSGSGPAYVYLFIEALSDAGVKMGLPREIATRLAAQTVRGAAQMVLETGQHPGQLKDMVTSPGGTTIAALHALEKGAFRGTVMDAVQTATQRSKELS